ncbi:MAG: hypothetical protein ACI8RZ_007483 [Myxococcota bacterium]|jgi:hypothetical protein
MMPIGTAAFIWYPNEADATPYTLNLGQCFSAYAEAPEWTVSDARSLNGARHRCIAGTGRRIVLTIQRIKASTARGREGTAARLVALQNHLNRGGSIAFTARTDKAVAIVVNGPLARGSMGVNFGSQPFTALFGSQSLVKGDVVRLETSERVYQEEQAIIDTFVPSTSATFNEEVLHSSAGPILMTYAYCFPALKKPAEVTNVNITENVVGRLWSMSLELVIAPDIVWGVADAGVEMLGIRAPDGDTNGNAGLTLDDPTFVGDPSDGPMVRGSTRPGVATLDKGDTLVEGFDGDWRF